MMVFWRTGHDDNNNNWNWEEKINYMKSNESKNNVCPCHVDIMSLPSNSWLIQSSPAKPSKIENGVTFGRSLNEIIRGPDKNLTINMQPTPCPHNHDRHKYKKSRQILQIDTSMMPIRSIARVTALSLLWKFTSAQFCTSLKTDTWAGYVDAVSEALEQTGFAVLCPFEISGDGCQGVEEYQEGLRIHEGQSQVLISCDSLLFGYHQQSTECVINCPGRHITVSESSSLTLERMIFSGATESSIKLEEGGTLTVINSIFKE